MIKCETCMWRDGCAEAIKNCEDYTPSSAELYENMMIDEYENDLLVRHTVYGEQVEEYNE